jgi:transcriptional regulator with XRE-family HTH domain
MNAVIASNIRQHRETLTWTQEQLAQAANISPRTVQRAEEGRGLSAETLLAIAGAMNISVEALRFDFDSAMATLLGVRPEEVTEELIANKLAEAQAKYLVIPLAVVRTAEDLRPLFAADAMCFESRTGIPTAEPVVAALEADLRDYLDIGSDLNPLQRHEASVSVLEIVGRLNTLGVAVSLGMRRQRLRFGEGVLALWTIAYFVLAPASEPSRCALVEKNVSFQLR